MTVLTEALAPHCSLSVSCQDRVPLEHGGVLTDNTRLAVSVSVRDVKICAMSKFVSKLVSFEVATPPIVRERLEELVPVRLAREMLRHAGYTLRAHPCVILALVLIVVLRRVRVWVRVRVWAT